MPHLLDSKGQGHVFNFDKLFDTNAGTFEESLEDTNDTNLKARLTGVLFQMKTFDFFFGLKLAYGILQHTDNLAKALQKMIYQLQKDIIWPRPLLLLWNF